MKDLLIIDGIKYEPWTPNKEPGEFDIVVTEHLKDIFGDDVFYFDIKQMLKSDAGIGSIPDGFLINFNSKKSYMVEFEISKHSYDHMSKQALRLSNAVDNRDTIRKIRERLFRKIDKDPILKNKVGKIVGGEAYIYKTLVDIVPKTTLVVIIDKVTKEAEDAYRRFAKIVEFKTYTRKGVGLPVHAHIFQPFYKTTTEIKQKLEPTRARKGKKTPDRAYRMPILETLIEMGGSGRVKDVLDKVGEK